MFFLVKNINDKQFSIIVLLCYTISGFKQIIIGFLTFNIYGSNLITIKGFSTIDMNVFLKPFVGFKLLPLWFLSTSHDVFSQDNIDGSSVLPLMFFLLNS